MLKNKLTNHRNGIFNWLECKTIKYWSYGDSQVFLDSRNYNLQLQLTNIFLFCFEIFQLWPKFQASVVFNERCVKVKVNFVLTKWIRVLQIRNFIVCKSFAAEAAFGRVLWKKVFLEISQNSQEQLLYRTFLVAAPDCRSNLPVITESFDP